MLAKWQRRRCNRKQGCVPEARGRCTVPSTLGSNPSHGVAAEHYGGVLLHRTTGKGWKFCGNMLGRIDLEVVEPQNFTRLSNVVCNKQKG